VRFHTKMWAFCVEWSLILGQVFYFDCVTWWCYGTFQVSVAQPEWGWRGHAPLPPETNLLSFAGALYQFLDSRRRQWLTTSLTGPSRINFWLRYCQVSTCNVVTSVLWCHQFQTRMGCHVAIYGHSTPRAKHKFSCDKAVCIWRRTVMYV